MNEILSSTPFLLFLVLASYLSGTYIYTKSKIALLHPIIISIAIIIGVLKWAGIDYETFSKGSYMIHFMLGPSVVALGFIRTNRIFKRKSSIHHFFYYCRKFSRDRKRNLDLQTNGSRT